MGTNMLKRFDPHIQKIKELITLKSVELKEVLSSTNKWYAQYKNPTKTDRSEALSNVITYLSYSKRVAVELNTLRKTLNEVLDE